MKYIIGWRMSYNCNTWETWEYYNPGYKPGFFTKVRDNAEEFSSIELISREFANLVRKYPEMDLMIREA